MMDKMMGAMAESVAGKMGAEGMVRMMNQMVGTLFQGMTLEDKIAFMQGMMGACMSNVLAGLSAEEKQHVATALLNALRDELGGQAVPDDKE